MKAAKGLLLACALASVAAAPHAFADLWGTMSPEQLDAAREQIKARRQADEQACKRLRDHARELCAARAKGREKVARAELEARYRPSPEAERAAKEAQAEATHALAKLRCKAGPEEMRERCLEAARHALEAAIRQAKVEKVERMDALKARAAAERKADRAS